MDYNQFISDLPPNKTVVFSSAEQNEQAMRRLGVNQHDVRQLGRGKFRSDMAIQSAGEVLVGSDRFNRAVSMYLEPPEGTVGLIVFRSANGEFRASGENVANDKLVVLPSGSGIEIMATDLCGCDAIAVPEARFIEITEALCPTPKSVRPEKTTVVEGNTAQLHAQRKAVLDMVAVSDADPHVERISNLLATMIGWMGHYSNRWRPEGLTVNGARTRVAKQAREFIEAYYRNVVLMEDLCRVTGVGIRTLQRCFREYFDLTVTEYVKILRLDKAHRELATANPKQETVSAIAMQTGFTHLGRFSVEFREHFGESPFKTLAASRSE